MWTYPRTQLPRRIAWAPCSARVVAVSSNVLHTALDDESVGKLVESRGKERAGEFVSSTFHSPLQVHVH